MLQSLVRSSRVACQKPTKAIVTGKCLPQINKEQVRTAIQFERQHKVGLIKKEYVDNPRLKVKHHLYRVVGINNKFPPIECVLLEDVSGVGKKGQVIEVPAKEFHHKLFIEGKALYATEENIEDYGIQMEDEEDIQISLTKRVAEDIGGLHLRIPMSQTVAWQLDVHHVQTALRKLGINVNTESILLPTEPVTEPGAITLSITIDDQYRVKFKATVYGFQPGIFTDKMWGTFENPPLDGYLEQLITDTPSTNLEQNDSDETTEKT